MCCQNDKIRAMTSGRCQTPSFWEPGPQTPGSTQASNTGKKVLLRQAGLEKFLKSKISKNPKSRFSILNTIFIFEFILGISSPKFPEKFERFLNPKSTVIIESRYRDSRIAVEFLGTDGTSDDQNLPVHIP